MRCAAFAKQNGRRFLFLVAFLFATIRLRLVGGVMRHSSDMSDVMCGRVPGLTGKQREMCRSAADVMVAVGDGVELARQECRHQFRDQRWNCTAIGGPEAFAPIVFLGSREAAFTYAINAAGVTYAIASACARGSIRNCSCDHPRGATPPPPTMAATATTTTTTSSWRWIGCSVNVDYGLRFARRFLDAREALDAGDARSLMNLHNNRAGRNAVRELLLTKCVCHGLSGACTMRTCWRKLPPFRAVGDSLMKKYYRARAAAAAPALPDVDYLQRLQHRHQRRNEDADKDERLHLVLKKGRMAIRKQPKKSDLVFLQSSPNYCERDLAADSVGTHGRVCNRTSHGHDGCNLMCCGRGYNTHQYTQQRQCRCKFQWCCEVQCDTCSERIEEYTCK